MTSPAANATSTPSSLCLELATVSWDDENRPHASAFDDIYFSSSGAEFETEHVFLEANRLTQRWAALKHSRNSFSIGEIGFGTGLNFAKTLQLWETAKEKPAGLHYIAFEKHPLSLEDMVKAHTNWPHLKPYFDQLLAAYFPHNRVCLRLFFSNNVILDLHLGDALSRLHSLSFPANTGVDCWFLDGFSPKQNTDLWSEPLCNELARLSNDKATLSTYSAAGWVRANLTESGFEVNKVAGFGGKRHMLTAAINKPSAGAEPPATMVSWAIPPAFSKPARNAVVIGAGLAGASVAHALAQKGLQVTVIDSCHGAAGGASGIRQLALRPRLFRSNSAMAEFYLQAYIFAQHHYNKLNHEGESFWHKSGVLQSTQAQNKKNPLNGEQLCKHYGEDLIRSVCDTQASELAGLRVAGNYLYFPDGGWLNPHALCRNYLSHPNITKRFDSKINSIEKAENGWLLKVGNSEEELFADIVVLANGLNAARFDQTLKLPLEAVRGQATYINTSPLSGRLSKVIMGERSLFPNQLGQQTVSASYRRDDNLESSLQDNEDNLSALQTVFEDELNIDLTSTDSKVALRCNSKDFLPIIGAVTDSEKTQSAFAALKRSAKAPVATSGLYHQGLYITAGHGSNGAATCPLAAEFIAGLICGEASILTQGAIAELSAARFLIRDLKQQV